MSCDESQHGAEDVIENEIVEQENVADIPPPPLSSASVRSIQTLQLVTSLHHILSVCPHLLTEPLQSFPMLFRCPKEALLYPV